MPPSFLVPTATPVHAANLHFAAQSVSITDLPEEQVPVVLPASQERLHTNWRSFFDLLRREHTTRQYQVPREAAAMIALDSPLIRLGLRAFQFTASLIAVATIAAGFRSEGSAMLGSHSTNFGLLMTYTTMLYSLYDAVVVEQLHIHPRLQRLPAVCVDGVFALILFIAGIVLATSDVVSDCKYFAYGLRCGNLKAGTAFTFIAMVGFIASVVIQFLAAQSEMRGDGHDLEAPQPYVEEVTPKGPLSPIGGGPSPSAKI